ncbi:putative glutamine transport system permease protein [Muricomes intestini]|uniref:Putative glutamine transport system permease protein n=3 Tax=Muricomes intestini TaxID=1796634 RepID=A0A4R3KCF1_9FIRM|nr:amino acid ABC transporter permease [Muricomes intestini]TCS80745.1 putative glutamine transport system permease protein [Muricomes intestini]
MNELMNAFESVFTRSNIFYMFRGLGVTLYVALISVILSVIFGTILALFRTYGNKFLKGFSVAYIELFRNTPNLLWVLAIRFMVRMPEPFDAPMYSGILAFTLFTSAVMAEIVRGGLNSVHAGQFEAAYSQGFNFFQTMVFIILPQCYKAIVPAMLSQVITVIKDTSFLAQVAIEEFFNNSKWIMSAQIDSTVNQSMRVFIIFGFVALVYFIINFTLSCIVRNSRKKQEA